VVRGQWTVNSEQQVSKLASQQVGEPASQRRKQLTTDH
jgi:hypothetical protein